MNLREYIPAAIFDKHRDPISDNEVSSHFGETHDRPFMHCILLPYCRLLFRVFCGHFLRSPRQRPKLPANGPPPMSASCSSFTSTSTPIPSFPSRKKETAARVAKELKAAGVEVTEGVGGTGVVGVLKNGKGPTVMLRTDLDALPVTELTGLAYASKVKVKDPSGVEVGVMHACGHDIHITNLVAMARYFSTHKDQWAGTLMFLGQPAEERGSGAKKMLDDKLFERFGKPDYALALHCDSSLASDKVGCRGGFMLANVDSVDITVRGRGGHGADAAHDGGSHRHCRPAHPVAANHRQPRNETDRPGCRHRRLDPRRHQAQHHRRHLPSATHGPQLLGRSSRAYLIGHPAEGQRNCRRGRCAGADH